MAEAEKQSPENIPVVPAAAAGKRPFYKRPLGCAVLVLTGLAVLAIVTVLLIGLTFFSDEPNFPLEPMTQADRVLQTRIAQKVVPEILRGEPETAELHFSAEETRSLLRIADNGLTLQSLLMGGAPESVPKKHHKIEYKDGRFDLIVPLKAAPPWFFGGNIVADFSTAPEKTDERLKLGFGRFRAGKLQFPGEAVGEIERQLVSAAKKSRDYQKFNRALKDFRIGEDGGITVVYRPKELRNAIFSR